MYFIVNHRCYPKVTQLETLFYFLLSVKGECVAIGASRKQTLHPLATIIKQSGQTGKTTYIQIMSAPKMVGKMWVHSQNTNDSLKESNDLKRWNAELEIDRRHFETIRTADTEINLYVIIIVIIIFIMLCQCTWLILHSRKFDYSTRYIKCNENNVQARELNEPVGFLVSSLNNLGSR